MSPRLAPDQVLAQRYCFYLAAYDSLGAPDECLVYRANEALDLCVFKPQNFFFAVPKDF